MILSPAEPVPAVAAMGEPEGDIPDITLIRLSAAEFESRCKALAAEYSMTFALITGQTAEDGSQYRIYQVSLMGMNAAMAVYLDGAGDGAPVSMVIAMGMTAQDCPLVLFSTITAYAAVTGFDGSTAVLSRMLLESPLWSDLCDLWPLLSDGRVSSHLQEDSSGLPMGFVAGMPGD